MKVIGITGGIASGKSTASAYLKTLGAVVWDADAVSRALTAYGAAGSRAIRESFGEEYFTPDGALIRAKLAEDVFADSALLQKLNAILHPMINQRLTAALDKWREQGAELVFLDVPLLFESGMDVYCDEIWAISCGEDEQLMRLAQRGLTQEEAARRMGAQLSDRQRRARASRVIDSSAATEDTQRALRALYEEETQDIG